MKVPRKLATQSGQRVVQIFVSHDDVGGSRQRNWRKVPDGAHSARHQQVRHSLSAFRWSCNNADMNTHARQQRRKLFQRQHMLSMNLRSDLPRVCVEGCHNAEPELLELGVPQQRRAQIAGPDQEGIVRVIPAQALLNFSEQLPQLVTHLRTPNDPGALKVLPHLHRKQA